VKRHASSLGKAYFVSKRSVDGVPVSFNRLSAPYIV
jgi:hypothetical protein